MAVETDRLIVVFEAQVKAFERAVRDLKTTTAQQFAALRSDIQRNESAFGRAGGNLAKAMSAAFGINLRQGLTIAVLFAIRRMAADALEASAEAGNRTSAAFSAAWETALNKLYANVGDALAQIGKATVGELHGIFQFINRQTKGSFGDLEPKDLADTYKLLQNPPPIKTDAMEDAAKEYENARKEINALIDALEDEAVALKFSGLQREQLLNKQKLNTSATDEEVQRVEELTEAIFRRKQAEQNLETLRKNAEEEFQKRQTVLEDAIKDLAGAAEDFTTTLVTGLAEGADAAEVLKASLQDLGRMLIQLGIQTAFKAGSAGLGIPGFQHGGSFMVPGAGGVDSQLVAFKATPGERVSIHPPGMVASSRGSGGVHMGGINVTVQGSADERTLAIMERRISQAQAQQMRQIERNFGAMQSRYSSLRG